ncbi:HPr family phosphocarrier protein [Anaerocolumna sp. AGMB13025]|uniref:HPr family phosphocarrier protein n=1 Tax=Anaerocolumna sp. AGMB13025 TaxID=3039116 RepID=UPI00241DF1EC|nr:HPr family phosphocarrier protein [Anaerocolumna sp. AGMB13025]WFR55773.1 HPr family phosphocarrier protein [Anaerocolumna sp. AGMB13025]
MEKITVTVTNPVGLHARPASLLTKLVKGYACDIQFFKNGDETKKHQPKSILSVMALGAVKGDKLTFEANGADEKEAIKAIEEFVNSGCGE